MEVSLRQDSDQILIESTEDDLQRSIFTLQQIGFEYSVKISLKKTKIMAFKGKSPVRSKIVLDNKTLEQVSHFRYLGCDISYDRERDIDEKINRFQMICGTINRSLKDKVRKETKLKLYKTMAVPMLLYGSETWVESKAEKSRIQAAEMRFLRRVKGCTRLDRFRNDDIRRELDIFSINRKIADNRRNWIDHINRMPDHRIVKQATRYRPRGHRDVGRPRNRWNE